MKQRSSGPPYLIQRPESRYIRVEIRPTILLKNRERHLKKREWRSRGPLPRRKNSSRQDYLRNSLVSQIFASIIQSVVRARCSFFGEYRNAGTFLDRAADFDQYRTPYSVNKASRAITPYNPFWIFLSALRRNHSCTNGAVRTFSGPVSRIFKTILGK